jgi:AraC-like DNA-binding protein
MALIGLGQELSSSCGGSKIARHHHSGAYAAIVLRGNYVEAGDSGRFRAAPGDVLLHRRFDGHCDAIGTTGVEILNLALDGVPPVPFGRVRDADQIVRSAARGPTAAVEEFWRQFESAAAIESDWPDLLAAALRRDEVPRLDQWADEHGLHPASLSRGFRKVYGVSPQRFRLEHRASQAARRACRSGDPLGMLAAESGFADQAHMTRAIAGLFANTPAQLRRLG